GELRCASCGAHRGWLPHATRDWILATVSRFGAPSEPIIVRQLQQENKVMAFQQKPMSGSLFKNSDKAGDNDRDYGGSLTLDDGRELWVSGWVRTSKSGGKYLSLSVKYKVPTVDKSKPIGDDLNDAVAF